MIWTIIVTTILVASIILWVIGYNTDITTMEAISAFFPFLSEYSINNIIASLSKASPASTAIPSPKTL